MKRLFGLFGIFGLFSAAQAQIAPTLNFPGQCPTSVAQPTPTPIHAHASGSTGAVSAALASPGAGIRNYVCGWDVSALGTAGVIGPITVTNTQANNIIVQQGTTLAAGATVSLSREYNSCIPAVSLNQAISVATTADATATAVDVDIHGCQY